METKINYMIDVLKEKYIYLNLKKVFLKQQNTNSILKFGYICPGASKTVKFIKKNIKNKDHERIFNKIIKYTDALFFIEIIAIYRKFVDKEVLSYVDNFTNSKYCTIAKIITKLISIQFQKLPKYISHNLPDDFYHLRHKTLICSNDKKMVNERIKMLRKFYENYTNTKKSVDICNGKRDGVSGCRDCCRKEFGNSSNYFICVQNCMNY